MERIVTLGELKELRERLVSSNVTEEDKQKIISFFGNTLGETKEDTTFSSNFGEGKTLVKTNPNAPSLLEKTPSSTPTLFDKTGFSNIIYLASISLVFEVLFLAISFLIYK